MLIAVAATLALGGGLWLRRRTRARAGWWLLPGVLLGPTYVLACALVLWHKPRWTTLVGR
jgi:hypothetical protein